MPLADWLVYLSFVVASTATPGPAVLLAMSNGTARGLGAAACSSVGNIVGLSLLSLAAFVGVGALLSASPMALPVLQLAGATYLIHLGVRRWIASGSAGGAGATATMPVGATRSHLFAQGVLVALSNPKAILFFGALLPQFVDPARPVAAQFALLTAVLCVFSFSALMSYAGLARLVRRRGPTSTGASWLGRSFALVFVLLGLWLAAQALGQVADALT